MNDSIDSSLKTAASLKLEEFTSWLVFADICLPMCLFFLIFSSWKILSNSYNPTEIIPFSKYMTSIAKLTGSLQSNLKINLIYDKSIPEKLK